MAKLHIPETNSGFMRDLGDGNVEITITVPAIESAKVAGHDFANIENFRAPRAVHEWRYRYGLRGLNDKANSAAAEWRKSQTPPAPLGTLWHRDESAAWVAAYVNGTLNERAPVDPTMREARTMALAYIFRACGVKSAKDAADHPKAGKYYKAGGKTGAVRDDEAIDVFIAAFDTAQSNAGKPELGFVARAREVIAVRNAETSEVDIDALI